MTDSHPISITTIGKFPTALSAKPLPHMNQNLCSTKPVRQTFSQHCRSRLPILLAILGVISASLMSSSAQVQTAGTVFINVDATTVSPGALPGNDIANSGSLGGFFESTNTTFIAAVSNVNSIVLSGTNYLRLKATAGGALVPPPAGLIGSNATCSIEVWALNPQVAGDECMISWGARVAGQNMAFEYGTGTSGGAQHSAADIAWDPIGGGAPLNGYWHHLVYTCDGTNQSLYADGVLANSQPVTFATTNNQGIALGAQWASQTSLFPGTTPALATLAIARIRVHDGALTAAQVLNNYTFEQSAFVPAAVAPAFLSSGPVHRYSFNEAPTNDATGLTFLDSVGTAHGQVMASYSNNLPQFWVTASYCRAASSPISPTTERLMATCPAAWYRRTARIMAAAAKSAWKSGGKIPAAQRLAPPAMARGPGAACSTRDPGA